MKKALRCLFASPQNNLKIFSDGKAVPVSRYEEYCYLSDLIIQVLTHNLETPPHSFAAHSDNRGVIFENDKETLESQNQKSSPKQRNLESLSESSDTETTDKPVNDSTSSAEDVPEEQCDVVDKFSLPLYSYIPANSLLPSSSILGRILQMQSLGKISGLQAAIFFKELSKRFKSKEALYQRIADFQTFSETLPLNNFVKDKDGDYSVQLFVSDHTGEEFLSIRNEIDSLSTPNLIELLQQALIAMTFKDLSLMILMEGPFEFTPLLMIRQSPFWLEQPPGSDHWYKCQVSFIDMALKCPSKILEHESSLNKLQEVLCCLQENSSQPFCCKPKTEKRKL